MTKHIAWLLVSLVLVLSSWTVLNPRPLNANSWAITIGEKELLASWKGNIMGDTAIVKKGKVKSTDTLFVQRYLCGSSAENSICTLIIKNQQDEIVGRSTNNKNKGLTFIANMPLTDLLESSRLSNSNLLEIYFTIKKHSENIDQTVLLGRLRLK